MTPRPSSAAKKSPAASHAASGATGPSRLLLIATVLVVAGNLRPSITVVGPLIERIGTETGMDYTLLGLLGAIPVLTFAAVSPFVHHLAVRWGMEKGILLSLIVLSIGTVLRSLTGEEAGLLAGTVLLGAAIAVGNVLVPAVVKRDFPDKVPLMTGLYTATLSATSALSAGTAVPLANAMGWDIALGFSALFSAAAAGFWSLRLRGAKARDDADAAANLPAGGQGPKKVNMWTSAVAWQVTAFMGLQSGIFYFMITWLPSIQVYHGAEEAVAGGWMAVYQIVGIAAGVTTGPLMQRTKDQRGIAFGLSVLMAGGITGIILAPEVMPLWVLVCGYASGCALPVSLSLMALRARNTSQAGQLSGMSQGAGYALAAASPLLGGALFSVFDSWVPVLYMILGLVTLQAISGLFAGRNVYTHPES